jgi:iron(III) transport system substrate-binding protein
MLASASLTGLGASRAHAAPSAALVEAAKREGRVVVYSAYISPVTHGRIATAFEKAYGIKIEYLTARGAELRERARIEQSAGRYLGDILHTASSNTFMSLALDKTLESHGVLPNAAGLKPE